jgi:plasmid stabilization system protein ParE
VARKKIIWSSQAEIEFVKILEFFNERNKSFTYSRKLANQFKAALKQVSEKPEIGLQTQAENIRGIISGNYILFYHLGSQEIMVLKVWDSRQNPERVKFKRI